MGRHPLLLGAAVLFWGWQADFLVYAALMAAALEATLLVHARMDFKDRDFERISDLSAVLLAGLTLYHFDEHGFQAIFPILQASPFVFFALVLAQRFSTRDRVSHAALFLSVRRGIKKGRIERAGTIDVEYPFFFACLLAASAGNAGEVWFFPGLATLVGWVLWRHRPPGRRLVPWLVAAAIPGLLALGAQAGMVEVRRSIEPLFVQLFQERLWSRRDPYRARTAIGHIGRLKLSQRIVARVRPSTGGTFPPRLRETVYQTYSRQLWLTRDTQFAEIDALGGGTVFAFGDPPAPSDGFEFSSRETRIYSSLFRGRGMLIVPNGTYRVQGLNVDRVRRNHLGSTKVDEGPDLIEFTARFGGPERYVDPPGEQDLAVPRFELPMFRELATDLGLAGLPPHEVVRKVREFFSDGFTYSLVRKRRFGVDLPPLKEFLTVSRRGHCEYYATATALLLRAAGVPARYVSGYAVNEWSPLEESFVVRRSHAHSWASAFVNGAWEDVDTTPAVWADAESELAPWWLPAYDFFAWLRFQFTRWRYDDSELVGAPTLIAVALLLSVILAWRLVRTTAFVAPQGEAPPRGQWPGIDSEIYDIERYLADTCGPRGSGETWGAWLARLTASGVFIPGERQLLDEIVPRHYRYRFDPYGLTPAERRGLGTAARNWLANASAREEQGAASQHNPLG